MDALYQKQILELAKQSRTHELDINAPLQASCDNPTCGDRVDISFELKDDAINNIGIKVRGCALCEAGAGLVVCLLYTSPSPRDLSTSRMPSSA